MTRTLRKALTASMGLALSGSVLAAGPTVTTEDFVDKLDSPWDMAFMKDIFRQPVGPGCVRHASVEHRFNDFKATTHNIADHDAVRLDVELLRIESLVNLYPELLQMGAHRRVDVEIAAAYVMTGCARESGHASHERSANSKYVYMHSASGHRAGLRVEQGIQEQLENEYRHCRDNTDIPVPVDRARDDMPFHGNGPQQDQRHNHADHALTQERR